MGLYGERGDDTSVFMGYDESADLFVFAQTDSVGTANSKLIQQTMLVYVSAQ